MRIIATIVCLCLFLPFVGFAQESDLRNEEAFFQEQSRVYNKWLQDAGLGVFLKVEDLVIEKDRLSLYLSFPSDDIDYVVNAWTRLKEDFEKTSPLTLEQNLFYKAVHFMQLDQQLLDVQIYDTYDLSKAHLFLRGIYFSDGEVKVAEDNPRAIIKKVTVPKTNIPSFKNISSTTLSGGSEKDFIYKRILQSAKSYYESNDKRIDGRVPVFEELGRIDNLRFEVTDLTKEVVTDASSGFFCPLIRKLGYDCNWSPREVLTYTVSYVKEPSGDLLLTVEIDGRLGSGVYASAKRRSYISLEVEYYAELEKYAEKMRQRFLDWLSRP